jgi:hypothetical protein
MLWPENDENFIQLDKLPEFHPKNELWSNTDDFF